MVFLSEDDFWAPFFALMEHTVAANLTPASFREAVTNVHSIDDCFAALEARVVAP
jgi:hypothetical protein